MVTINWNSKSVLLESRIHHCDTQLLKPSVNIQILNDQFLIDYRAVISDVVLQLLSHFLR